MSAFDRVKSGIKYGIESLGRGSTIIFHQATSEHTQKMALSSMVFGTALIVLLITAILVYSLIYLISMPIVMTNVPVYLDYSQNLPSATLDVSTSSMYGLVMKPGQRYNLAVELEVPESEVNLNLGNFMVSMELLTKHNISMAKSTRPVFKD